MYQRFKNSLFNPKQVFLNVSDSFKRVIVYVLSMVLLMMIPVFLVGVFQPTLFYPTSNDIYYGFNNSFKDKGLAIVDGKFENKEDRNILVVVDGYNFSVGEIKTAINGIRIIFEEETIAVYQVLTLGYLHEIDRFSYEQIGFSNFSFEEGQIESFALGIVNMLAENKGLILINIFEFFITYLVDYFVYALFFSVISMFFYRLPLTFSTYFKISIYLLTGWAMLNLLLSLFNLGSLYFYTTFIAYIYHIIAFRSVKVIKKIGVDRKDDE